jgi:hypothetical protein
MQRKRKIKLFNSIEQDIKQFKQNQMMNLEVNSVGE